MRPEGLIMCSVWGGVALGRGKGGGVELVDLEKINCETCVFRTSYKRIKPYNVYMHGIKYTHRSKLGFTIPLLGCLRFTSAWLLIPSVGEQRLPCTRIRRQVQRRHALLVLRLERCARLHLRVECRNLAEW